MLRFYDALYWDSSIPEKKQNTIKWRLKVSFPRMKPYHLVTLCEGPDQLEIYNSLVLRQKIYKKHPRFVIGIANSYEGALDIVTQITEECVTQNNDADLKKYLLEHAKDIGN